MSNFIPVDLLKHLNETQTESIGKMIKEFYLNGSEITLDKRQDLIDVSV
jgi:hypothetical protein